MIVVTEGFHPPWVEGSRNILLGWLSSLSLYKPTKAIVVTTPDPKYPKPASNHVELRLRNSSSIYIKLVTNFHSLRNLLYKTRPPLQLNLWRNLVEYYTHAMNFASTFLLARTVKFLLSKMAAQNTIPLVLHNLGPRCLKWCLSPDLGKRFRKVVLTLTFAETVNSHSLLRTITEVACKFGIKFKIVVSSPYIRSRLSSVSTNLSNYIEEVKTVPPIPMLGSILRNLGLDVCIQEEKSKRILNYIRAVTRKYAYTILYVGQLNEVRFPSSLLIRLCRVLKQIDAAMVIVASPSHQSRAYLAKIRQLRVDLSNIHIITYPLDPDAKESLLELIDLVIFPHNINVGGVVDPPLFLIEALAKGKRIVAFDNISVKALLRLVFCGRTVPIGKYDEFVNAVLLELKDYKHRDCYGFKSLFDPKLVGRILVKVLYE